MRLSSLLLGLSLPLAAQAQPSPPYLDPALAPERRAEDLLARLTLPEKLGQLTQIDVTRLMGQDEWDRGPLNPQWLQTVLGEQQVGSLLSGGGAAPVPNTPRAWAEFTNTLQRYALAHSRLHIPILYGADAVHGHNNVLGATLFPHNLGLAATFDPELARLQGEVTARALRATGVTWNFAPVADVGTDPRWGRFYETFGESPSLGAEMVAASVRGLQGAQLGPHSVAATLKHFVGYGAPDSGRDRTNATISPEELWNVQLPSFQAGLAAGAATVMANSGSVNGAPVHASGALLTGLLRAQLGFQGVTVSDWEDVKRLQTVYQVAPSYPDAVAQALNAGVDVAMVPHDAPGFTAAAQSALSAGALSPARLDEAVRRVLTLKFALGLFEHPYSNPADAEAAVTAGRDLALRAARESITLLRNEHRLLPLRGQQTVLVLGVRARDPRSQLGGWAVGWQGVPPEEHVPAVTVLDGLKRTLPQGMRLAYRADAADLPAADTIVAVVGEEPGAEGKADNPELALPAGDLELLRRALKTGRPVVAVLLAGRPLVLPADVETGLSALVMAYLPGSEGGQAVADVLWGSVSPSGRLPFRWPRSAETPAQGDNSPALYPFGAGQGYTTFSERKVQAEVVGDQVEVRLEVANTGPLAGAHSVLVSARGPGRSGPLAAFGRVTLRPGETRPLRLSFPLARLALAHGAQAPRLVPGTYTLSVAGDETRLSLP